MDSDQNNLDLNSDDNDVPMSALSESQAEPSVELQNPFKLHFRIPFPNELYAESAMKALAIDAPFQDTKNKKSTIRREQYIEVLEDGVSYLNIELKCDEKN